MKPRVLKISGLNSFEEEQTIDFQKLTEKGLFGIFGPTGSGKSTILDAITIALYGKVTRTNRGYINTTKKNLIVSYEFEIGLGKDRKTYLAERNLKINKNGGYNTKYARLIEKGEEDENLIAEGPSEVQSEIEKIIGLTSDDFTRSVVLPQGKFSEFLKLTGKDKRDMLERIFGLEKYGKLMLDKIKKVRNRYLKQRDVLTGELKKYEEINEEKFKEYKFKLENLIKEEKIIKDEKKKLDENYEKYKVVWELQKELKDFRDIENNLNAKLKDINVKKEKLKRGKNALNVKPYMDEFIEINRGIEENNRKLKELTLNLNKIEESLKSTEGNYEKLQKEKDEMIPELIKKQANLTQAIEIDKKIEMLKKERDKLRDDYTGVDKEKKVLENKLKLIISNREKYSKEIENIEIRLKEINVEPEYRDKVQSALEKENEYTKCLAEKNDIELKIKNRNINLEELLKRYKEIFDLREKYNDIVEKLESKVKDLQANNPGDNNLLLKKAEKLNNNKEILNKALKDISQKEEFQKKLNEILKYKAPLEKELSILKEEITKNKELLVEVKKDIEHINKVNLASTLSSQLKEGSPCPVCGSLNHLNPVKSIDKEELNKKEKEKDNIETHIEKFNDKINELSLKLIGFEKEEEYIKNEYNLIVEGLKEIEVLKLQEDIEKEEKEFNDLKNKIEMYFIEKDKYDRELSLQMAEKSKVDMQEAKLSENIKMGKSILVDLNSELLKVEERLSNISKEYLSLKEELKLEDIALKMQEIKEFEKESLNLQKMEKKVRDFLEKVLKESEEISFKERKLDIEIGKIIQSGKEKSEVIKGEEEKVKELSQGENPYGYLEIVTRKIENISKEFEKFKIKLQEDTNERQKIWDKKLASEEAKNVFNTRLEEQNKKFLISLKDNGFENRQEVEKALVDEKTLNLLEEEVNSFEDKFKNIKNNVARIEDKLNGESIEENKWEEIKNGRIEKEKLLNIKIKEIATLQKIVEDFEKDLKDLKELRKKEKELEHKLSLLRDLSSLVEGNKFVEFVAMNQLKYIAREASRRLKEITRERYALEIDGEGNFKIRDDFNGGEIRDTNTLSGGETFLASLSLALALSSQVQLKGSAPLEFFFLDEGFGTLDTELLDIVMSSLERLHNSKLSVGIISHVEELKNRVPVKLIVTPAKQGEGGSKVKLEYS